MTISIRYRSVAYVVGLSLMLCTLAIAQRPQRNISSVRHPNLAAAQRLTQQAWDRILVAQKANEWDMGGHAQRAKELLDQANRELKLAAETANKNPR
jgi:hypothetical protein